jgi:hypothetical protein
MAKRRPSLCLESKHCMWMNIMHIYSLNHRLGLILYFLVVSPMEIAICMLLAVASVSTLILRPFLPTSNISELAATH